MSEKGFIIAQSSPFIKARERKYALRVSLEGRPKDTFETPRLVFTPRVSLIIFTLSRVIFALLSSDETAIARGSTITSFLSMPYSLALALICSHTFCLVFSSLTIPFFPIPKEPSDITFFIYNIYQNSIFIHYIRHFGRSFNINKYFKLEKDEYHTKDGVIKSYAEFFVRDLEYDKEKGCYKKFVVVDSKGKVRYDLAAKEVAKSSSNEPVIEKQPEPKKVHEMQGQGNICVDCGIEIKPNVATYSNKKFGSPYCFNCQQKHKAS